MINEELLKETVTRLVEHCRDQYRVLTIVMDEVQALRESVRGLDPTFDDVMDLKRSETLNAKLAQTGIQKLDEIANILRSDLIR